MSEWYSEFNSTFWLTIAGVVSAALAMCLKALLKSKCSTVDLCCIKCIRDTQAEKEEDLATLSAPSSENNSL